MTRLVPQNPHAPLVLAAFHLEHLRLLELLEARMRQVERDGDRRRAVGGVPLVAEVDVKGKPQPAVGKLGAKLCNPLRQRPLDRQRKVRHTDVQQRFVIEIGPVVPKGSLGHPDAS